MTVSKYVWTDNIVQATFVGKYALKCAQTKYLTNYRGTSKPPANIKYFSRIMVKFKDL